MSPGIVEGQTLLSSPMVAPDAILRMDDYLCGYMSICAIAQENEIGCWAWGS